MIKKQFRRSSHVRAHIHASSCQSVRGALEIWSRAARRGKVCLALSPLSHTNSSESRLAGGGDESLESGEENRNATLDRSSRSFLLSKEKIHLSYSCQPTSHHHHPHIYAHTHTCRDSPH